MRSEKFSPPGGVIVDCSLVEGFSLLRGRAQPPTPVQDHLDIPGGKTIVSFPGLQPGLGTRLLLIPRLGTRLWE